ncbi:hypothetical protein [Streptodolium elevatio]|uniref:Uncharacterized protein n=1 Tax=Streptodolium elevatio TaxID=3157996 RepID=A0ABV3DJX8_9ACTN
MARAHGRTLTSIWDNEDFCALDEGPQRLYLFLISQPNLNHAGLLPLTLKRWARKARGLSVAGLEERLHVLADARFVVLDEETEEVLIRTFVRNDGVWKMPKVMGAMVSGAQEISSHHLRRALLAEMDRIPLDELSDEATARGGPSVRRQIADHIGALRKAIAVPDPSPLPDPSGGGSPGVSEPPAIPLANPFAGGSASSSETLSDPPREPSTHAHARTSHAHSPAPAPAPTPTPAPDPSSAYGRQEALPGTPEPEPDVVDAELVDDTAAGAELVLVETTTAQTLVGEWIDNVRNRPPGNVIGQVSKQLKQLLDEGIDPHHVRAGLAQWAHRGLHPSALPALVNEVMNRTAPTGAGSRQQQETDDMFARMASRAAARVAAKEQEAS